MSYFHVKFHSRKCKIYSISAGMIYGWKESNIRRQILHLLLDLLMSWKLRHSLHCLIWILKSSSAHFPFQVENSGNYCAVMIALL